MPTMTQQQVYDIISQWLTTPGHCWQQWKNLYNFLPPDEPSPSPTDKWTAAGQIAAVYDGPVRS